MPKNYDVSILRCIALKNPQSKMAVAKHTLLATSTAIRAINRLNKQELVKLEVRRYGRREAHVPLLELKGLLYLCQNEKLSLPELVEVWIQGGFSEGLEVLFDGPIGRERLGPALQYTFSQICKEMSLQYLDTAMIELRIGFLLPRFLYDPLMSESKQKAFDKELETTLLSEKKY